MKTYQVNEIFKSVQGEGVLAGVPSTFIRLQGCTVGCPWCDTKYTWAKGGTRMTVDEIVAQVPTKHVVITGGEPTAYNLDDLIAGLWTDLFSHKRSIQLETSAQHMIKGDLCPDFVTWSPKENLKYAPADPWYYSHCFEIKFVVDDLLTLQTVSETWVRAVNACGEGNMLPWIVLMPEGCPPTSNLVNKTFRFLDALEPNIPCARFGDRLQWRLGVK